MAVPPRPVLVTGATGYIGQRLIPALVHAIEDPPPSGTARIVDVPEIRASRL